MYVTKKDLYLSIGQKKLNTMKNETNAMLSQLHIEVVNGIVSSAFDLGEIPTIESVKSNWQYKYFNIADDITINDTVINTIIANVARYYN